MINKELLNELKEILREDFNLTLSIDEVAEVALALIGYFDLLVKVNFENK
jgi:hypothetical protein